MISNNRLIFVSLMLFVVLGVGSIGYQLIEGYTPLDAMYMSVITVTTVGYSEVAPLSETGKMFTIALILVGVGIAIFSISLIADWFIQKINRMQHLALNQPADNEQIEEGMESQEVFDDIKKSTKLAIFQIKSSSKLIGMSKISVLKKYGLIMIAVEDQKNRFNVNVPFEGQIRSNSKIIMMGAEKKLKKVEKLL